MITYFIIFSISIILFSFIVFRFFIRRDYLTRSKLTPVSFILELIVFALHANFAYLFLPVKWPNLPALSENSNILFFFFLLTGLGLIILLIAWFKLGTAPSFGLDKNQLRTTGIYRFSRNPQLFGYGLILLGYAIMYFSWHSISWFIMYLVISWFMILTEEEFLKTKYGKEYEDYCKNVPRIFNIRIN
jgi:protein-S-isoprenylcysteine O-methyltransferase Ste14